MVDVLEVRGVVVVDCNCMSADAMARAVEAAGGGGWMNRRSE